MMTNSSTQTFVRLALTTALASAALAGCTGKVAPAASASVAKAQMALEAGKGGKAVRHAEAAVLAAPRDAATRVLLGHAYVEDGRFFSAAASFADAVTLGDTSPRTVISLALAQIGMGDQTAAAATLDRFEEVLDPADFGLAVALAGQPQRGIYVLSDAIRAGQNTVTMRQNLAYAYALAGHWREARLMAAQDVAAGELGNRMAEWGALAQQGYSRVRVAQLLGVEIGADAGQPAMLALGNNPGVEQLAAEAAAKSEEAPAPAFALASELPALEQSVGIAPMDEGEAALADGPAFTLVAGTRFVRSEMVQAIPAALPAVSHQARRAARSDASPGMAAATRPAGAAPAASAPARGDYNIQLGSYFSMSDANAAWVQFQKEYPQFRNAQRQITKARVKGKIYYRVAAAGYAKDSARALCSAVRSKGGGCFAYAANSPLPGTITNGNVRVAAR